MTNKCLLIVLAAFLSSSQIAFAWGPRGQEITVLLAERYLSPRSKTEISRILGTGRTLSQYSSWADQVRSLPEWAYTDVWHYINVAEDGTYDDSANDPALNVLQAINQCITMLKESTSQSEKAVWLKFLIHLVGDLHQPMHVGRAQDRGGNSTSVRYGKPMNLHFLWDSGFIEKKTSSSLSYANVLIAQNRGQEELSSPFRPEQVVREGFALRSFIYSFKNDVIDSTYEGQAFKVVDERLWTGGIRLAAVLNSIYDN